MVFDIGGFDLLGSVASIKGYLGPVFGLLWPILKWGLITSPAWLYLLFKSKYKYEVRILTRRGNSDLWYPDYGKIVETRDTAGNIDKTLHLFRMKRIIPYPQLDAVNVGQSYPAFLPGKLVLNLRQGVNGELMPMKIIEDSIESYFKPRNQGVEMWRNYQKKYAHQLYGEKPGFWEKYGHYIITFGFLALLIFGWYIILDKINVVTGGLNGATEKIASIFTNNQLPPGTIP